MRKLQLRGTPGAGRQAARICEQHAGSDLIRGDQQQRRRCHGRHARGGHDARCHCATLGPSQVLSCPSDSSRNMEGYPCAAETHIFVYSKTSSRTNKIEQYIFVPYVQEESKVFHSDTLRRVLGSMGFFNFWSRFHCPICFPHERRSDAKKRGCSSGAELPRGALS